MENDLKKKLPSNQQLPPKTVMRQIWLVILKGSPSDGAAKTPLNNLFGKCFIQIDKINVK